MSRKLALQYIAGSVAKSGQEMAELRANLSLSKTRHVSSRVS